ncbi:hypothetical protein GCM10025768_13530 [Microbacterium pseudoresistens]|uniref:Putative dehydrogenase n=1 Tax=Microbacterium pseudoresistens TaxID=640634 RepID=A0A7Y9EST2_9MICO|nr:putative dehydrogenase [Microbacterium pseudoresistens]
MTVPNITRLAVVGAGRIAHDHVRAANELPDVEIVAVVDPDRDAARRLADLSGAGLTAVSIDELPDGVDGAILCSPTRVHAEQARTLVTRGIGVMVEKPLSDDLGEATALLALAERCKVTLMPAQVLRHLPLIDPIREVLASGRFGSPVQAIERRLVDRADNFPWWRELPAFLISHWGSHSVDLICHLFADEARRVVCEADSVRSDFGVIDDFSLLVRFHSGLRMTSSMSFSSRVKVHDLVLIGTGATVTLDCYRSVAVDGETVCEGEETEILAAGFRRQLRAFVDRLCSGSSASNDDVLSSLRVLAAAEHSAREGTIKRLVD